MLTLWIILRKLIDGLLSRNTEPFRDVKREITGAEFLTSRHVRLHEAGAVSGASCSGSSMLEWKDDEMQFDSPLNGLENLRMPPARQELGGMRRQAGDLGSGT